MIARLLLLLLLPLAAARAQEAGDGLYATPTLVLDPAGHTAIINGLDTDAAGRFLVTASSDKTVRVWAAEDGRLLSTIRLPSGPGNLGKAYAVALSPDGERIAAGGWTKGGGEHIVYLFERATGRLLARSAALPNVAFHLAFAPDGQRLAVGLGGANGLRLLDGSTLAPLGEDPRYSAAIHGAAFASDGRLAVASNDGLIRLYGPTLTLLAKVKGVSGYRPNDISFSSGGRLLAVGYVDSWQVDIFNGEDLVWTKLANSDGIMNGSLSSVAWTSDEALAAAGRWHIGGRRQVRRWKEEGRDKDWDIGLGVDTITELVSIIGDRVAFATAEPSLVH